MLERTFTGHEAPRPVSAWSSDTVSAHERYDAWAQTLSDYFLP